MDSIRELAKKHVLGNPIRLGIMIYLLPRGKALFSELVSVLDISPGNLDSHLRTLQKFGYIEIKKVIRDRPRTAVFITEKGATQLRNYLAVLKKIVEGVE